MRRILVPALVLVGLLLTACSGADQHEATGTTGQQVAGTSDPAERSASPRATADTATAAPPSTPRGPFAQPRWRSTEVRPASAPVLVGGALVLHTHRDQRLSLTALDPEDGTILWSRPAATSQTVQGVAISA